MALIWFLFWFFNDFPKLEQWNAWTVGLIICCFIDVLNKGAVYK